VPLIARHEAPEVLQPCEEPFDLPAATVAAELSAVLCDVPARRAVWGDELDAALGELGVQGVAVVTAVADDARRQSAQKATFQGVFDQ
jgi:hypothetical protein